MRFRRVACLSEIEEGQSKLVRMGGEEIALWRVDGMFFAISNVCAHQHAPALHLGILQGRTVACPRHGWTYSLETGIATTGDGRVRTFAVKRVGDDIYLEDPDRIEDIE
jgi:nitrite reductase/ring-hydroxylating ferredoxin subunit